MLWSAAGYEYDGVVKLLLERDGTSPNIPGTDGGTPLLWAACQRHDAVVELLLGREDVNPNIPANNGMTPLSVAAVHGHGDGAAWDNKTLTPMCHTMKALHHSR